MKLYYDLHIHSALSPCGDESMTPNNIVNMALLKGLDLISVTDHNHIGNSRSTAALARARGLLFLPGIEIHTLEDIHILCYFETLESLEAFFKTLDSSLCTIPHDRERFGTQLLLGEGDEILSEYPYGLLFPVSIKLSTLVQRAAAFGGLSVPAHVHRKSYGIISQLGFLPEGMSFAALENPESDLPTDLTILRNSDAHFLGNISERIHFLQVRERSIPAVFEALKGE
ncbi:MAG: hypothetical protein AVO33_06375 [delta proteobacterium ML8_F1]|nr:MAG: hypothetical protein AVO33_06375 [delta proteobacterium ML8_F1]